MNLKKLKLATRTDLARAHIILDTGEPQATTLCGFSTVWPDDLLPTVPQCGACKGIYKRLLDEARAYERMMSA